MANFGAGVICLFPGQMQASWDHRAPAAELTDDIRCGFLPTKQKRLSCYSPDKCAQRQRGIKNVSAGVHRGNNLHVFTGATVCWLANVLPELFSDVCLSTQFFIFYFFGLVNCLHTHKIPKTKHVLHCSRTFHIPSTQLWNWNSFIRHFHQGAWTPWNASVFRLWALALVIVNLGLVFKSLTIRKIDCFH